MNPLNHNHISLYQQAKSSLSSLVKQTSQVFVGFIIMLLLTGGNPPGFIVALSVGLGISFVAWSEIKRFDDQEKEDNIVSNNQTQLNKSFVQRKSISLIAFNEKGRDNLVSHGVGHGAGHAASHNAVDYHLYIYYIYKMINYYTTEEKDNNLGLTSKQWETFWNELTPKQKIIITYLQENKSLEDITKSMKIEQTKIVDECRKVYLKVQSLRQN